MSDYKDELVAKAAWYYYIEEMTQQDISGKLGLSRMKVIKLLETAKQNGIIHFKINREKEEMLSIEKQFREKYGLKDVFIIPTPSNAENLNDSLAHAAATYVASRISEHTYINVGYGETVSKTLNRLATITDVPISAVSLTGGVSYYLPSTVSNVFKAKLYLLPAPLLLSSKELCSAIEEEQSLKEIRRMTSLASMSLVGIGSMDENATIISNGILSKSDFTYLSMQGAVGDILTNFIDKTGKSIHSNLDGRLISTPLERLGGLKDVLGIAGGLQKVEAIRAALIGGYLDAIITDEDTAKALL